MPSSCTASAAVARVGLQQVLGERQLDAQHDQPLLRPVVQVALDPRALGIGHPGDALARFSEL